MQCQKRGCAHNADHAVKICVPRFGQADDATHVATLLDIVLCEEDMAEFDAAGLLDFNPDLRSFFLVAMNNGPSPDFDRAYAVGVRLTDPEYLAMKLAANRKLN